MPTPFTHLRLATDFLEQAGQRLSSAVADLLISQRGPFLLGSIAPDVRILNLLSRYETHFYPLPPDPRRPSMGTMLGTWPSLAHPEKLSPEQAAFVCGYVAHLWYDEFWYWQIILPYYLERDDWGTKRARFNVYNVLLAYLDVRDKAALGKMIGSTLLGVEPAGWLPFVTDSDLVAWRDLIVEQLETGAITHTVDIMARRAQMSPEDFSALIADERRMGNTIFSRTPRATVEQAYADGLIGSVKVIMRYLGG